MDKNEYQDMGKMGEKPSEKLLTVKETANMIEETPSVVRNWMKDLKPYIPLQKNESGYNVFNQEAIEIMKRIKQMHREQNYSIKQIEHYLATGGEAYQPVPEKGTGVVLAEELKEMRQEMAELKEYSRKQTEFNQQLIERLNQQHDYIKSNIESMRQNQENKQAMLESESTHSHSQDEAKIEKKGSFSKWLGGLFGK